jgi:large subunit ribosomal protein L23
VEELFGVKVKEVRTSIVHGKVKRFGRSSGKRSNWKKAFVRLDGEGQLDLLKPAQA